jgi:2-(1,2-epoxy-1,2-dihydrophenyl)acetyl-CoA isomerase
VTQTEKAVTEPEMTAAVRTEHRSGVVRLVLQRPAEGNALNLQMAREALTALRAAEADPDVHLLTLTGEGRFFCGGGDVRSMAARDPEQRPEFLSTLADAAHELALAMTRSRLLIVAGVNGVAAGAGLGLMLNSDWVLVAAEAPLMTAYASIGLTPDTGVSYWLPRLVGHQRAVDLTLGDRRLTGAQAVDWGLANRAVPAVEFSERLTETEDRFLSGARHALFPTKQLLRRDHDGYETHLAAESAKIAELSGHPASIRLVDDFAGK